jgi:hypothetical protein
MLHVVEDPVPDDEETGDDHVGENTELRKKCHKSSSEGWI